MKPRFRSQTQQKAKRRGQQNDDMIRLNRDRKPVVPKEVYSSGPSIQQSPYKNLYEQIEMQQMGSDEDKTLGYSNYKKCNGS